MITNSCLGKGAFGEVYSGIVKNEDGSEECVAIKVRNQIFSEKITLTSQTNLHRLCTKAPTTLKNVSFFKKLN